MDHFVHSFISFFLVSQAPEPANCEPKAPVLESIDRAKEEYWTRKVHDDIEKLKSVLSRREYLKKFISTEMMGIYKNSKGDHSANAAVHEALLSLLSWYGKNFVEKDESYRLFESEFSHCMESFDSATKGLLLAEAKKAGIATEDIELSSHVERVQDEDVTGIPQSGQLRVWSLKAAMKAPDSAIRLTAERFGKSHSGDFLVIELPTEIIGPDPSVSIEGYRLKLTDTHQVIVFEDILKRKKDGLMFAQVVTQRPRTLIFTSNSLALMDSNLKVRLEKVERVEK